MKKRQQDQRASEVAKVNMASKHQKGRMDPGRPGESSTFGNQSIKEQCEPGAPPRVEPGRKTLEGASYNLTTYLDGEHPEELFEPWNVRFLIRNPVEARMKVEAFQCAHEALEQKLNSWKEFLQKNPDRHAWNYHEAPENVSSPRALDGCSWNHRP